MANKASYSLPINSLLPERDGAFSGLCVSSIHTPSARICPVSSGSTHFQSCLLETWPGAQSITSQNPPGLIFNRLSVKLAQEGKVGAFLCKNRFEPTFKISSQD